MTAQETPLSRDPNKSTAEELEEVERRIAVLSRFSWQAEYVNELEQRAQSLRSDYAREGW